MPNKVFDDAYRLVKLNVTSPVTCLHHTSVEIPLAGTGALQPYLSPSGALQPYLSPSHFSRDSAFWHWSSPTILVPALAYQSMEINTAVSVV
ncbi:hypothetical protein ElyMa_005850900 [Elysia marginata]|uniref:Uncharacterized protein n=1 Tax=Elysia marginata TaxID=1093978 RepID=A0AAV4FYJ7_9GAST|nr:hypothetical protein ElyMa_005850900 [Elysia marginata]